MTGVTAVPLDYKSLLADPKAMGRRGNGRFSIKELLGIVNCKHGSATDCLTHRWFSADVVNDVAAHRGRLSGTSSRRRRGVAAAGPRSPPRRARLGRSTPGFDRVRN